MLSAVILIPCLVLLLLVRGFGTVEFFLITLMMLLDFIADASLMVFTSRRTVEFGGAR